MPVGWSVRIAIDLASGGAMRGIKAALDLLEPAYASFGESFDNEDLRRVKTLLPHQLRWSQ